MNNWIVGAEFLLALLLALGAISKAIRPAATMLSLTKVLPVIPPYHRKKAVRALAAAELVLATWLTLAVVSRRSEATASTLTAVLFSAFLLYLVRAYKLRAGCGCKAGSKSRSTDLGDIARGALLCALATAACAYIWVHGTPYVSEMSGAAACLEVACVGLAIGVTRRITAVFATRAAAAGESSSESAVAASADEPAMSDGRIDIPAQGTSRRELFKKAALVGGLAAASSSLLELSPLGRATASAVPVPSTPASRYLVTETPLAPAAAAALEAAVRTQTVLFDHLKARGLSIIWSSAVKEQWIATFGARVTAVHMFRALLSNGAGAVAFSPEMGNGSGLGVVTGTTTNRSQEFVWVNNRQVEAPQTVDGCENCVLNEGSFLSFVGGEISCVECFLSFGFLGCAACAAGVGGTELEYLESCPPKCRGVDSYSACVALGYVCDCCGVPDAGGCSCQFCQCSWCQDGCHGVFGGPMCWTYYRQGRECETCYCCCPEVFGFSMSDLTNQEVANLDAMTRDIGSAMNNAAIPPGTPVCTC
jgi:hypothetical protein